MKRSLLFLLILLSFSNCKQAPSKNIIIEVHGRTGQTLLKIKNFSWSYGTTELNKFSGDFDKLDQMVFDSLKGIHGHCIAEMIEVNQNKYGNYDTTKRQLGSIDLKELNKFQSSEYWHKAGGIRRLIYKYYIAPKTQVQQADSAVVLTGPIDSASKETTINP